LAQFLASSLKEFPGDLYIVNEIKKAEKSDLIFVVVVMRSIMNGSNSPHRLPIPARHKRKNVAMLSEG
jgi:hypothetical protein